MERQFDYTGFYGRNYAAAVFYACKYVGNEEDARDVVGEVFLQFLERSGRLETDKNVGALFYTMLHSRCMDYLRHLNCYSQVEKRIKQTADCLSDDEFTVLCQKELFRIVGQTLSELPEEERTVFCEIRLDGKSYKEVARKRNITSRCVEYRLKKATGKIRERLLQMYG